MSEVVRWSPFPAHRYVRTIGDKAIGPGANRKLIDSLAAWNLYWLTFPFLERHTDLSEGEAPIVADPLVDVVMETIHQYAGCVHVGVLSLNLYPANFVAEMENRDVSELAIVKLFGRDLWLQSMRSRVEIFMGAGRTELDLDLTPQKNGTNAAGSTNMLPLVEMMRKLLH